MPASLFDPDLVRLLEGDRLILSKTQFPIVTVSASFRDVVELQHAVSDDVNYPDVVFSRAHYSMALAIAIAAWGKERVDREKAWLVDPTNYVNKNDWQKIAFSEQIGRILARNDFLAWIKKNLVDRYGRKKLPITAAITPPLLFLTEQIHRPIISVHDQTGNILAGTGKTVIQVVTDPFVRPEYLYHGELPTMHYCVFDEQTRTDLLTMAQDLEKDVPPERVTVTGPPVDPRIVAARDQKSADGWYRRPLHLLLTTGGLGTNKEELHTLLEQLLPLIRQKPLPIQLVYYAGTNEDHAHMVQDLAKKHGIRLANPNDQHAPLRLLYADDVVVANQYLIVYGFPWADVVFTKPSGDMAYDAVAAGCGLFFLEPWGAWERTIQRLFIHQGLARNAEPTAIVGQLQTLAQPNHRSWLTASINKALSLPPTYLRGAANILAVARRAGRGQTLAGVRPTPWV